MLPHASTPPPASLFVVGIGIQWAGQTTAAARSAIERADRVLFAVADPFAADWIRSMNPAAESLRYPRDGGSRKQIYQAMVEQILIDLARGGRLCVVFYGSPAIMTLPAHLAIDRARAAGFSARMLPAVSFLDCLFCDLGVDPAQGCQIYEASDFLQRQLPVVSEVHLILSQVALIGNRGAFSPDARQRIREGLERLTERLSRWFPPSHEVVIYEAAVNALEPARMEHIALRELSSASIEEVSTLYVPPFKATVRNPREPSEE